MSTDDSVRRTLLSLDIQQYGEGDDVRQHLFQSKLTEVVRAAAHEAGLDESSWDIQRSGDGILAVLPESQSESKIVDDFVRLLDAHLTPFNQDRKKRARLRLRLAIHHGPIARAANGYVGEGVLTVSRIVDSNALRSALSDHRDANLAVAVTDTVYEGTVARGRTTLAPAEFVRTPVEAKEFRRSAWIRVPGARRPASRHQAATATGSASAAQTPTASSLWPAAARRADTGHPNDDGSAQVDPDVVQSATAAKTVGQAGRDLIVNAVAERAAPATVVTINEGKIRAKNVNFGIQHGRSS